jgi:hypothetical protein
LWFFHELKKKIFLIASQTSEAKRNIKQKKKKKFSKRKKKWEKIKLKWNFLLECNFRFVIHLWMFMLVSGKILSSFFTISIVEKQQKKRTNSFVKLWLKMVKKISHFSSGKSKKKSLFCGIFLCSSLNFFTAYLYAFCCWYWMVFKVFFHDGLSFVCNSFGEECKNLRSFIIDSSSLSTFP